MRSGLLLVLSSPQVLSAAGLWLIPNHPFLRRAALRELQSPEQGWQGSALYSQPGGLRGHARGTPKQ